MTAPRVSLLWSLLFVGGVLAVFLLTAQELPFRHAGSEAPPQTCALDRAPSTPAWCAELAQGDPPRYRPGEAAWFTQC